MSTITDWRAKELAFLKEANPDYYDSFTLETLTLSAHIREIPCPRCGAGVGVACTVRGRVAVELGPSVSPDHVGRCDQWKRMDERRKEKAKYWD